jgi:hypothetical protein
MARTGDHHRHAPAREVTLWCASRSRRRAFEAIASTLPLGSVGYENATNERGGIGLAFTAHAVELV